MQLLQMSGPSRFEPSRFPPSSVVPIEPLEIRPDEEQQLQRLDVSTLELLRHRKLIKRREHKFLCSRRAIPRLFDELSDNFKVVPSNGTLWGSYHTLYFDSAEFGFFQQHRRGRRPRHKVRIRHYVERDVCYLETKTKDCYETTTKRRFSRAPLDFELSEDDRATIAGAIGRPPPLSPSLWVTFPRVTLVGTESLERITVDLGLHLSFGRKSVVYRDLAIVELKQRWFDLRSPGYLAMRQLGMRPHSLSKYCTGLSVLGRVERTARFQPALRELTRKSDV